MRRLSVTSVISFTALLISFASFFYSARTYYVSHRPYVGIVEVNVWNKPDPPLALGWTFVLKNVGSVPAKVRLEENNITVTTTKGPITVPGDELTGVFLMPGQTATISGYTSNSGGIAKVEDVLSGRNILEVSIRLLYESPGGFLATSEYYYRAKSRFQAKHIPPAFAMIWSEAN